jgi:hypothetical protein
VVTAAMPREIWVLHRPVDRASSWLSTAASGSLCIRRSASNSAHLHHSTRLHPTCSIALNLCSTASSSLRRRSTTHSTHNRSRSAVWWRQFHLLERISHRNAHPTTPGTSLSRRPLLSRQGKYAPAHQPMRGRRPWRHAPRELKP